MKVAPSISDLLGRLNQLEDRTTRAEERAARAEAEVVRLQNATGNMAAVLVNPKPISRRGLLMKAAGVGAAGVAGSLLFNRPKDALAAFAWNGGVGNIADSETVVLAQASYPSLSVLLLDANQAGNASTNIDGLQTHGTGAFSGVAGYGGNKAGVALFGIGGPAVGSGSTAFSGTGVKVFSGPTAANQVSGPGLEAYQFDNQPSAFSHAAIIGATGASDHSALSTGLYAFGADSGYGVWGDGGRGNQGTPEFGGGPGVVGNSGSGNDSVGVQGYGDLYNRNTTASAHGTAGFGNALGVGGWFTGGRAALALGSSGTAGPPTALQHFKGDVYLDVNQVLWVCLTTGTPGTFEPLQPGGMNNALFTTVSTQQYNLPNSNGTTWVAMDATNLKLAITPTFNCQAVISGSADLWTANAGFNQDIGIAISGGLFPTSSAQPEGWKESGGFAGTFSPNAAHVESIVPLTAGTPYVVTLVWKTNHPGASTIFAGAGPINAKFSPTRLSALLVATKPGGAAAPPLSGPIYEIPVSARPARLPGPGKVPSQLR